MATFEPITIDDHTYFEPDHIQFISDMQDAGMEVRHYRGRFYWEGPAASCDEVQEVMSNTKVPCQQDSLGLGFIVYPKTSM